MSLIWSTFIVLRGFVVLHYRLIPNSYILPSSDLLNFYHSKCNQLVEWREKNVVFTHSPLCGCLINCESTVIFCVQRYWFLLFGYSLWCALSSWSSSTKKESGYKSNLELSSSHLRPQKRIIHGSRMILQCRNYGRWIESLNTVESGYNEFLWIRIITSLYMYSHFAISIRMKLKTCVFRKKVILHLSDCPLYQSLLYPSSTV